MTRQVVVNDRMQQGCTYHRTESIGRNFAPGFAPELTPKQMLALGVFGGKYMTDCRDEFHCRYCMGRRTRDDARQTVSRCRSSAVRPASSSLSSHGSR